MNQPIKRTTASSRRESTDHQEEQLKAGIAGLDRDPPSAESPEPRPDGRTRAAGRTPPPESTVDALFGQCKALLTTLSAAQTGALPDLARLRAWSEPHHEAVAAAGERAVTAAQAIGREVTDYANEVAAAHLRGLQQSLNGGQAPEVLERHAQWANEVFDLGLQRLTKVTQH
ncbi:MAG: hypothetical protein EBX36_07940, partial [Planctomycetia bacterium]|nr:hypothetical protein [Planctomycetia bacterium]